MSIDVLIIIRVDVDCKTFYEVLLKAFVFV